MKTWVRKSLNVGVLSAGFLLVTGGAAHADWDTSNNTGLLNGNQLDATVQAPISACGNAISLFGTADATCTGGAWATESGGATESSMTGYNTGLLNGNQISALVQAPIDVCGNAIAVLGFADASCEGGAGATAGGHGTGAGNANGHSAGGGHHSGHNNGGYTGGGGQSGGGYTGGGGQSSGGYGEKAVKHTGHGGAMGAGGGWMTGYNAGILNGNQASAAIQVPINICGNAISVFGFSSASCTGGAWATESGGATESWMTGYNAGILNGNQISALVQVPINICGNAISVFGVADASCDGGAGANAGGGASGGGSNGGGSTGGSNGGGYNNGGGSTGGSNGGGYNNGGGSTGGSNGGGYNNGGGTSNGGYGAGQSAGHSSGHATGHSSGQTSGHHGPKHHKTVTTKTPKSTDATGAGQPTDENGTGTAAGDPYYGGNNGTGTGAGTGTGHGTGHHGTGHHNTGGTGSAAGAGGACGDWTTGYNAGILNGNQLNLLVQAPIDISGNALAILGTASGSSTGGAWASSC